jgi:SAM-dependent methyltransferase
MDAWRNLAEAYDSSFGRLCAGTTDAMLQALDDATRPPLPRRLLDVGSGTGTLAGAAAAAGFNVEGVDREASMVAFCSRRIPGLRFRVGALPSLPYPDGAFDAVTANFVINHVARPAASVSELGRVCTSGGTVAITIWPAGPSPLNNLWSDVIGGADARPMPSVRLPRDEDFERSEAGLARLLETASLEDVKASRVSWTFSITPEELWLGVAAGIATIGETYRNQHPRDQARMQQVFVRRTAELSRDGLLHLESTAILASGRAT